MTPTNTQTNTDLAASTTYPNIHQATPKTHPMPIGRHPQSTQHPLSSFQQPPNTNPVAPTIHPTFTKQHLYISFINMNHRSWCGGEVHSKLNSSTFHRCILHLVALATMKTLTFTLLYITKTLNTVITLTFWLGHQEYTPYCTNWLPVTIFTTILATLQGSFGHEFS